MTVTPRGGGQQGSQDPNKGQGNQTGESSSQPTQEEGTGESSTPRIEDLQQELENLEIDRETQATEEDFDENGDPLFPNHELNRLDEMVNRPKWVIPVLPDGELEILLSASIRLARKGLDTKSESCQKFIRDGLTISFNKIFLDDAVSTWKFEIHKCILKNAEKLIELCVVKLDQDWFPLMDLLAVVLDPKSRFHLYNSARPSETYVSSSEEKPTYARPPDHRQPRGWLVDLVNRFGSLGGFELLKKRICEGGSLNIPVICAHLRPFGQCAEVLGEKTVEEYLMPCVLVVKKFLEGLTDEVLKKESKQEAKNEAISTIIKSMKNFAGRLPDQEDLCKDLEKLRLQMILRLLQVSSFNGKMNALNEINRVISNVSYYSHHRHPGFDDDEFLTVEMVAAWLQENNVLSIVLKDNLHQPQFPWDQLTIEASYMEGIYSPVQGHVEAGKGHIIKTRYGVVAVYVEKLEKIIRFAVKVKTLTLLDLDTIWDAQIGKHEAIVKNVHDLLAKLAWDFSAEQLDHLFSRFQGSWKEANKKQQEKLLELIRRLAEDDKEGVIAHKVLGLLWQLAHSDDLPTDIMDQALTAHIKILDYSCSQTQDRDNLKIEWIHHCVEELHQGRWVIPALKQIKAICELFYEGYGQMPNPHVLYRNTVIENVQNRHGVVSLVAENLSAYMNRIRDMQKADPSTDPLSLFPDGRYSHIQQIQERLSFLRFVLNDGKMWLCEPQAKQIWVCLAVHCVFPCDRDVCFKWFSKVMGDDPDLDPEICRQFFEENILKLDPSILNEHGIRCFERFFKFVNTREGHLSKRRSGAYVLEKTHLIGSDYLWKVILNSPHDIANRAIEILKEIYTNLGSQLKTKQGELHNMFIRGCVERLNPSYEVLRGHKDKDKLDTETRNLIREEARKVVLCLKTLKEYVAECDNCYAEERAFLPHERACRGKHITLYIRFSPQSRQSEDFEIWSHTNESLAAVRRHIYQRLKMSPQSVKIDLYCNGEPLSRIEDRRLVGQIPLKDRTVITVKLGPVGGSSPSSPDSSSDSSPPVTPQPSDTPNLDAEQTLPGVLMSRMKFASLFFSLGDLGMKYRIPELRDITVSLLNIIPTDTETTKNIKNICYDRASKGPKSTVTLDQIFIKPAAIQVLYNLQTIYSLLVPSNAAYDPMNSFQHEFILAGGIECVLGMLTRSNFIQQADALIRRSAFQALLKMSKLLFTVICYSQVAVVAESLRKDTGDKIAVGTPQHSAAILLQQALQHIPNPYYECVIRNAGAKIGHTLGQQATTHVPDLNVIRAIQKIAWAAAAGQVSLVQQQFNDIMVHFEKPQNKLTDPEDVNLAKEAMEVLTIALALCPSALEILSRDKPWQMFIIHLLLLCRSRGVRVVAAEQFFLIATKCSGGEKTLLFFIQLLMTVRMNKAVDHAQASSEYFGLLCRLLSYGRLGDIPLSNATAILDQEINWLEDVRTKSMAAEDGADVVENELLEGHLGITRELISYQTPQKKHQIGCEPGGRLLLKHLVDDFVFSASRLVLEARTGGDIFMRHVNPICGTPSTIVAALDLIVSLCNGCVRNLHLLVEMLTEMYYSGIDPNLTEWEYQPPIGPRPVKGFVGLKNAGATCYMNSVLQQLYMIPEIRTGILEVDVAQTDGEDDALDGEEKVDGKEATSIMNFNKEVEKLEKDNRDSEKSREQERKDYNLKVLRQIQAIFGHLSESKLQFHIPRGFWRSFRLWGEPVNLREQHDALEFFNTLVDNLDEGLKGLGKKTVLCKALGGSFADQKICKECPHRYSRETPFTALNVDVRNHHNLIDSLEQYVKGDLLEGANAYHCEKCDKKVDTVKRMCIKKLPDVLAIQLKRFDYDWERDCAVKFNDYFEFPREFDMEPFTVEGLAKIEGEIVEDDSIEERNGEKEEKIPGEENRHRSTIYKLVGVVVHSGQASGGHYYSYIIPRPSVDGSSRWYKFDDGDVSECSMDDDEEMKNQCFGGEYMGEVFDHMLKRMSYRRQKRWWNAYILFYERLDVSEKNEKIDPEKGYKIDMPGVIERSVRRQNIQFLHNRTQFSIEYFQFIKKLVMANSASFQNFTQQPLPKVSVPEREELALMSLQLLCKFLFTVGFHTKKNIRGLAGEWGEVISGLVRQSADLRRWFACEVLLLRPDRIVEYLIDCPVGEIRTAFAKTVVYVAHTTMQDGLWNTEQLGKPLENWQISGLDPQVSTLSDYILKTILELINKDVNENNKYLLQYFQVFVMYAGFGVPERKQLLDLGVLQTFIRLAIEDERSTTSRYQYNELAKLYSLVSILIRSCNVSKSMKSAEENQPPKDNPYYDSIIQQPIMPIPEDVESLIYTSNYVKKLLEESASSEETINLLKFLSWECFSFSLIALSEVLFQISYSYSYELRPFLDILLHLLLMDDSWQTQRLYHAFRGVSDDREGLFDTIQRSKAHSQKRGYQCIKAIVQLLHKDYKSPHDLPVPLLDCDAAYRMIQGSEDLKHRWKSAVQWLGDELERRAPSAYNYNNWSPPTQSNETSNGYFLERSHSARLTYAKAREFCEEDQDEPGLEEAEEAEPQTPPNETSKTAHDASTPEHPPGNVELSPQSVNSDVADDKDQNTRQIPGEESD